MFLGPYFRSFLTQILNNFYWSDTLPGREIYNTQEGFARTAGNGQTPLA